jgi:hypothetical protein
MTEAAQAVASHIVTYERILRGEYYADFRRDRRVYPDVFHCIIQREGNPEILGWTQHRTLTAAQRAAEAELKAWADGSRQKVANG